MEEKLNNIRKPTKELKLKNKIINSLLILLLGIALGIIAKWLDNLIIGDNIWSLKIIDKRDLGNVLS